MKNDNTVKEEYIEVTEKNQISEKTGALDQLEDALVLSFLTRKCLLCRQKVEIRAMVEFFTTNVQRNYRLFLTQNFRVYFT